MELIEQEVRDFIDRVGASLGGSSRGRRDFTMNPVFPEGRNDIAAVRRMAESDYDYRFDTIYVVCKDRNCLRYLEIVNSRSTGDYLYIEKIVAKGFRVVIYYGSLGFISGSSPWTDFKEVAI